jgi:hypothetical protein
MGKSQWGPPIWTFFHVLAENIKEEHFISLGPQMISQIIQISYNLPCPECAQHAKMFWSKTKLETIKTKDDLKNVLYVFHNSVNKRNRKQMFPYDSLSIYQNKNIISVFNNFIANFNTHGNMKLLTDSFHRKRLISSLRKWMIQNISKFNYFSN